jgi:poly-gamma-glutamate capsule biosynthesis protein CapA/YwtB (metallophosphatase superfamily)
MNAHSTRELSLFLCGDVMTGRGIDQILPHPGSPTLRESVVLDARSYVSSAAKVNGAIPRPVEFGYIWGDALQELQRAKPDVRIINLETSITTSDDFWPGKGIHYRMHPRNIGCITAANIDCCCLANNHVLDFGYLGLEETLKTLDAVRVSHAGAGDNATECARPATLDIPGKGRVLVFAFGSPTSGVPRRWSATANRAGINVLADFSEHTARRIGKEIRQVKRPGDVVVASIHWGSNWGYEVPAEQSRFARWLIEEGIEIIHGHSSHHVRPIEIYEERLILHGCGDFINDYESIAGYETFRDDLALMYFVRIDLALGRLTHVRFVPMQIRKFCLNHVSVADASWLRDLLKRLGVQARLETDNSITLAWD